MLGLPSDFLFFCSGAAQDTVEIDQLEQLIGLLDVNAAYPSPEENSADIQIAMDRQQVILQALYLFAHTGPPLISLHLVQTR